MIAQYSIRCLSILYFIVFFCCGQQARAQVPQERVNHAGKEFWLATNSIAIAHKCMFYITGPANANITFTYTSNGTSQSYFLQGGTVLKIQLSSTNIAALTASLLPMETINNYSLNISSDTDIVVQFAVVGGANDDGILLYPSDNQAYGNVFYLNGPVVMNPNGPTNPRHGQFAIVSRCDSTVLEITPSQNTINHPAGVPFTLVLYRGKSYVLSCGGNIRDLSGTKVKVIHSSCCNPINIFQAYSANYMIWPPSIMSCCADQMIEQILPVSTWDTVYALAGFRNNPYVVVKIVSAANNNHIYLDGTPILTLNEGQKYDTMIKKAVVISSDSLISVSQHMVSQSVASAGPTVPFDSLSDPASLWVIPLRDGLTEGYIRPIVNLPNTQIPGVPPSVFTSACYAMSVITIVSKTGNVPNVLVNGANVASQFVPFPNNAAYMYAHILMDTSLLYHIQSPERVFAYYYGGYLTGSSAFPIGNIHPSEFVTMPVISLTPDTVDMCVNGQVTITGDPADAYEWSDGSTGNQLTVTAPGAYSVRMHFNDSCKGAIKTYWVKEKPYDQLEERDTLLKCEHELITLMANTADSYLWFNGSTQQNYITAAFGNAFTVLETHQAACTQTNHIFSVELQPSDILGLYLGPDTAICPGEYFIINSPYAATEWIDGTVSNRFMVTAPGIYWAMVTDTCHDVAYRDTIVVRDSVCLKDFCSLVFPTAFSPNNDGRNDLFHPIQYGMFTSYYLAIYNRWGEEIYHSFKKEEGWNGMDRGEPAEVGVYYFYCTYDCPLKGSNMIKGEVTLVR